MLLSDFGETVAKNTQEENTFLTMSHVEYTSLVGTHPSTGQPRTRRLTAVVFIPRDPPSRLFRSSLSTAHGG
jgi:hypothetical protein